LARNAHNNATALAALLAGDEGGLAFFFDAYYRPLAHFAYRLTSDQSLAEEIAAEAFVKLWDYRDRLTEEGSIKAWLYSTVRNSAIDHLRRARRMRVNEQGLQAAEPLAQTVLQEMIHAETIRQVVAVLQTLPPKCRQVFRLFFLQGKSYDEIARELQISPHTVRNQKIRAIRLIREKMLPLLLLAFLCS